MPPEPIYNPAQAPVRRDFKRLQGSRKPFHAASPSHHDNGVGGCIRYLRLGGSLSEVFMVLAVPK